MQSHPPLKVIILGAGTGGLCLAQGLKANGIEVEVYYRDSTPTDRIQGYRLSINVQGSRALQACLPPALYDSLIRGAAQPSESVTFTDHRSARLLELDLTRNSAGPGDREWPVSRTVLRSVLLKGLGSIVRFGKTGTAFSESADGRITLHFGDGSGATADVLVGADGAGSHLRAQLLPKAQRLITDIVAVSGKFALDDRTRADVPRPIMRGPTLALGPRGCFLFANAVLYENSNGAADRQHEDDYVMWGFSAHREEFAFSAPLDSVTGHAAKSRVLQLMEQWDPALRQLVELANLATMTTFPVKTSVPLLPWPTRKVTLLGDAIHNMTPFRGNGANTALRDAHLLLQELIGVSRGEAELLAALARYERAMIQYGFNAVQTSLKDMQRFHSRNPLARGATKAAFRLVDRIPPLKSVFLGR
jgi:2-polyprenyl-6-methoxyphenol hydroxylase-like FAD-dependent oxidoreductase